MQELSTKSGTTKYSEMLRYTTHDTTSTRRYYEALQVTTSGTTRYYEELRVVLGGTKRYYELFYESQWGITRGFR